MTSLGTGPELDNWEREAVFPCCVNLEAFSLKLDEPPHATVGGGGFLSENEVRLRTQLDLNLGEKKEYSPVVALK